MGRYFRLMGALARYGLARELAFRGNLIAKVAVEMLWLAILREWGMDVVVAGSQKALMTPPGLGFVSVCERAMRAHEESRMPRFYFDWTAAQKAYAKTPPQSPWTPAVSIIIQLDVALQQRMRGTLRQAGPAHERAARDPAAAAVEMADVERVGRQALHEVREAVAGYRQASLSQELTGMREVLTSAGIEPRIEKASGPLPANVESVLAWAVREGVTNVVRHSRARRCTISLSRDQAGARVTTRPTGQDPPMRA